MVVAVVVVVVAVVVVVVSIGIGNKFTCKLCSVPMRLNVKLKF